MRIKKPASHRPVWGRPIFQGLVRLLSRSLYRLNGSSLISRKRRGELRSTSAGTGLLQTLKNSIVSLSSRRSKSCGQDTEGQYDDGQCPGCFLQEVSCLAHAECLVAGCEVDVSLYRF